MNSADYFLPKRWWQWRMLKWAKSTKRLWSVKKCWMKRKRTSYWTNKTQNFRGQSISTKYFVANLWKNTIASHDARGGNHGLWLRYKQFLSTIAGFGQRPAELCASWSESSARKAKSGVKPISPKHCAWRLRNGALTTLEYIRLLVYIGVEYSLVRFFSMCFTWGSEKIMPQNALSRQSLLI